MDSRKKKNRKLILNFGLEGYIQFSRIDLGGRYITLQRLLSVENIKKASKSHQCYLCDKEIKKRDYYINYYTEMKFCIYCSLKIGDFIKKNMIKRINEYCDKINTDMYMNLKKRHLIDESMNYRQQVLTDEDLMGF